MAILKSFSASKKRLLLAVVCGLLAALLISLYAGNLEAQAALSRNALLAEYGGDKVEVLVATRDIAAGETLSADNATMQPWLADLLPSEAFTAPEEAYGQSVSLPVYKNEPLIRAKISANDHRLEVPENLCALSIPVSDEMAVGGAIISGSTVDVYALGDVAVTLVAAGVLVLESSNGSGESSSGIFDSGTRAALKWVTLAVRAEMVSELLAAARDKNLSLVLPGQNVSAAQAAPAVDVPGSAPGATDDPGSTADISAADQQPSESAAKPESDAASGAGANRESSAASGDSAGADSSGNAAAPAAAASDSGEGDER